MLKAWQLYKSIIQEELRSELHAQNAVIRSSDLICELPGKDRTKTSLQGRPIQMKNLVEESSQIKGMLKDEIGRYSSESAVQEIIQRILSTADELMDYSLINIKNMLERAESCL